MLINGSLGDLHCRHLSELDIPVKVFVILEGLTKKIIRDLIYGAAQNPRHNFYIVARGAWLSSDLVSQWEDLKKMSNVHTDIVEGSGLYECARKYAKLEKGPTLNTKVGHRCYRTERLNLV